ncbi:MAG: hypothetical protein DMD63_00785 [Gemmatimonadetes bacterium]|nr:MAG: hypothetical protein DMD63_00785 [Gemmatimonadota bacterium]
MDDDRFDDLIRNLPDDFKVPDPPLEEMWRVIENAHFNARTASTSRVWTQSTPWLAAAAALLVGIGIGRYMPTRSAGPTPESTLGSRPPASSTQLPLYDTSAVADAYRDQTNQYLGQAAALLISLPAKAGTQQADATFANKAADLLVTTRLLIDSPAATQDPKLRSLLEDLELVLVQIARLRGERNKGDLDLIHQAVEQGDVISRLNSAVATTQSSE